MLHQLPQDYPKHDSQSPRRSHSQVPPLWLLSAGGPWAITGVDPNQSKRVGLIQNDGPVLVFPFQFLFEVTPQG